MERVFPSSLVESHYEEPNGDGRTSSEGLKSSGPQLQALPRPRLWAVGGGKGGVGKSLLSSNFSYLLAKGGRKVLAIDLDVGGANLHTCLGVAPPSRGVGDWATGLVKDLEEVEVETSLPNLKLIGGAMDPVRISELVYTRRAELLNAIRAMDYDDVIIDLGAGTAEITIDLFCAADHGMLVVLPEPTSVENAYRFLRLVFFNAIMKAEIPEGIREVIQVSKDPKNAIGIKTPADLLNVLERMDRNLFSEIHKQLHQQKLSIILNQVRGSLDIDVGHAICSVCKRYFGLQVDYAGYLDYDNSVWKAVRSKKPLLEEFPRSAMADKFQKIFDTLLGEQKPLNA